MQRLKHPRRTRRDRALRTCLENNHAYDARLAESFGQLTKAEQREIAGWMAAELRRERGWFQGRAETVDALTRIPQHLRERAWKLVQHGGIYASASSWRFRLERMAGLPEATMAAWAAWQPLLSAAQPRRQHAMTWLWRVPSSVFAGLLDAALADPEGFDATAKAYSLIACRAQGEADALVYAQILRAHAARTPLQSLAQDLQGAVEQWRPILQHCPVEEATLAVWQLATLVQRTGCGWSAACAHLFAVPGPLRVRFLERTAQEALPHRRLSRLGCLNEGAWQLARRHRSALEDDAWLATLEALSPEETQALLAAQTGAAQVEAVGASLPRSRRAEVLHQLRALPPHVPPLPDLFALAHAAVRRAEVRALSPQLAPLPASLRAQALEQLLLLPEAERGEWAEQLQVSREPQGLLNALGSATDPQARRLLRLADGLLGSHSADACDAVRVLDQALDATQRPAVFAALAALLPALDVGAPLLLLVLSLTARSQPEGALPSGLCHCEALVQSLRWLTPTLRALPLGNRLAVLRDITILPFPATEQLHARRWRGTRGALAALGQAMRWLAAPAALQPLPRVTAHERWERSAQVSDRAAALTERAPTDLADPTLVQAASRRGARELAACLGEQANLPPEVLFYLHEERADGQAAAQALLPDGTHAAHATACDWGGVGPLPDGLVASLERRFSRAPDAPALQGLFAFCDSLALPPPLTDSLNIAALEALAGGSGAHTARDTFTCAVCDESTAQHTHLAGCQCPPALCDGCAAQAVACVGDRLTCPTACPAPLNREYLERLGVDPAVREQRLTALARDRLRQVPYWVLPEQGVGGHYAPPPPVGPDEIPPIRRGHDRIALRLLLSGLAAWPNFNGDGVHRECYTCAQPVQKGDACMHMRCRGAQPHEWDFERGPYGGHTRFAEQGIGAQGYIPLAQGPLALAGFYDGLPPGLLDAVTRQRVAKRQSAWLAELGGVVRPQVESEALRTGELPAGGGFEGV